MENRETSLNKSIYNNSLIKVKDIVYVLVVMLLGLPLMLHQGDKEISVFNLILLTSLLIIIMIIGDNILRKYSLLKLKSFAFENTGGNKIPKYMKYIVVTFITLALFLIIKIRGIIGVMYVVLAALAMYFAQSFYRLFSDKILSIKYPKFYEDYKNNHIGNNSSIKLISCLIIALLIILIMSYGVIGALILCALVLCLKFV